jgi:hypothetical protein
MRIPRRVPVRAALAAALCLAVALPGCDSQPTVEAPSLVGPYVGFGGGYTWDLDLTQNGGVLAGTGTLTTADGTFPLAITGAYTYPVVGLALDAGDLDVFTFDGRVGNEGDLLTGTVESASGFEAALSFQRQ